MRAIEITRETAQAGDSRNARLWKDRSWRKTVSGSGDVEFTSFCRKIGKSTASVQSEAVRVAAAIIEAPNRSIEPVRLIKRPISCGCASARDSRG